MHFNGNRLVLKGGYIAKVLGQMVLVVKREGYLGSAQVLG